MQEISNLEPQTIADQLNQGVWTLAETRYRITKGDELPYYVNNVAIKGSQLLVTVINLERKLITVAIDAASVVAYIVEGSKPNGLKPGWASLSASGKIGWRRCNFAIANPYLTLTPHVAL